jgi:hypothetical protein
VPEHHRSSPSMYFENPQKARLAAIPASPTTETRRARPSAAVASQADVICSSWRSRPVNGASSPTRRPAPRRSATTRKARQARIGRSRPLTGCSPVSS